MTLDYTAVKRQTGNGIEMGYDINIMGGGYGI